MYNTCHLSKVWLETHGMAAVITPRPLIPTICETLPPSGEVSKKTLQCDVA